VIHGSSIDLASTRDWTAHRFEALADREGLLLVYPEGFGLEWNGCRNPGVSEADRRDLDDVGFISGLIDRFAASHAIDRGRVYAVGFSNGGQLAYRLTSDVPERFAAVAVLIAQVPAPENSDCPEPRGPIPILIMNGTADPIIPWEGGTAAFFFGISARGRVLSTAESIEHWRAVNGIASDEPEVVRLPDHDPDDGSWVERSTWRGDAPDREVVLYAVHGGGHAVPGGIELGLRPLTGRLIGWVNRDIDTAEELWHFFLRHNR
jgi:polyhydroxybutyrate depolymerase